MIDRSAVVQQILNLFDEPRYLEIGVDHGETFRALSAAYKTAVDPNFKFDLPANTSSIEYHAATSDEYFARHCPIDKLFDVVYIDGLHIFEQTLRDLLNAVLKLRPGGVIILDDILPVSYQSALPMIDQAFRVRDYLSTSHPSLTHDNTWMGDVYKLAFFIQTFMQQLSYATVQENHGQLIVWQSVRPVESLVQRSMLDIAMLGFVDTITKRPAFRIQPFQDIVNSIRADKSAARMDPAMPRREAKSRRYSH